MPSLKRMTSNIAAQVVAVAASVIDRIILVGLLLRSWGADVFSDYSVVQSWASLLLIAELGIQFYFQNVQQAAFVARDKAAFRRASAIHLGLILVIAGGVALVFTILAAIGATDGLLHLTRIDAQTGRMMLWMIGIGNLLTIVRSTTTTIYTAAGDFAYAVILAAAVLVLNTLASLAAVALGAGPLTLAALFLGIGGAASLVFCLWDVRRRYPDWVAAPARPNLPELRAAAVHIKWYSLQIVAPTVWLQAPILVFNAFRVSGHDITSFLLIRTMVNQIRQSFQFAAVGAGLEIATLAHGGDFAHAWRLSARVGMLTTVLCAASVAGVLIFGETVTLYWTGDATLFSVPIAIFMLAPLLAVAPLQQPVALLQYANMSLAPGLQRLLQICLGPVMCVAGQALYGVEGLVIGLAMAEILANWALVPLLARMPMFADLGRYCLVALAAAAGATALCGLTGFGLMRFFPSISLVAMAGKMGIWGVLIVAPLVLWTLPEQVRAALRERIRRLAFSR